MVPMALNIQIHDSHQEIKVAMRIASRTDRARTNRSIQEPVTLTVDLRTLKVLETFNLQATDINEAHRPTSIRIHSSLQLLRWAIDLRKLAALVADIVVTIWFLVRIQPVVDKAATRIHAVMAWVLVHLVTTTIVAGPTISTHLI